MYKEFRNENERQGRRKVAGGRVDIWSVQKNGGSVFKKEGRSPKKNWHEDHGLGHMSMRETEETEGGRTQEDLARGENVSHEKTVERQHKEAVTAVRRKRVGEGKKKCPRYRGREKESTNRGGRDSRGARNSR